MVEAVNRVLAEIPASVIRAINDRKRPTSLNLGLGEPSLTPDRDIVDAGVQRFLGGVQGYTRNAGLPELREAIVAHRPELHMHPDQVMVTTGTQEAVFCTIGALVNPGDEVVIAEPSFNIYGPITRLFGGTPVGVRMDPDQGFPLDADRLRAAITPRTRLVCVVSPGNPTGRALDEKTARALAALAEEKGITLLVDEVYRELHHTPEPAPSPGAWSKRVVTISGLSKSCAMTGLRIGWMMLPEYLLTPALKLHQLCATCAASMSQHIAVAAFEKKALFRHRAIYTERLDVTLAALREHTGLSVPRPEGAFYTFLDFRTLPISTVQLSERLLEEEDVVMIPGEAFGPSAQGFLRISFAQDTPIVVEGIRRLGALLRRVHAS